MRGANNSPNGSSVNSKQNQNNPFESIPKSVEGALKSLSILTSNDMSHPYVREEIEKLDLEPVMKTVDAFAKEIEPERYNLPQSVALSLSSLEDVVLRVHEALLALRTLEENHKSKWFWGWRRSNFEPLMKHLASLKQILDKRIDLFLKVVNVMSVRRPDSQPSSPQHQPQQLPSSSSSSSSAQHQLQLQQLHQLQQLQQLQALHGNGEEMVVGGVGSKWAFELPMIPEDVEDSPKAKQSEPHWNKEF